MPTTETTQTNEPIELTFENIQQHIIDFELSAFELLQPTTEPRDQAEYLALAFELVAPILEALIVTPLIPTYWQQALSMFVHTFDLHTATFKAGKDLAIGPLQPTKPVA